MMQQKSLVESRTVDAKCSDGLSGVEFVTDESRQLDGTFHHLQCLVQRLTESQSCFHAENDIVDLRRCMCRYWHRRRRGFSVLVVIFVDPPMTDLQQQSNCIAI